MMQVYKDLYKYHIYKCSTISKMFDSGRKHRYKVNTKTDGTFHYKLYDIYNKLLEERANQKLNVCKNCLGKFLNAYPLDYHVNNFNLKEFHDNNSSLFGFDTSELEKGEDATHNKYSEQWKEISTQFKIKKDYTCEDCGWRPNNVYQQKFIHTHHQNGDKTNNGKENLKVLCIECHANVDEYHTQIKSQDNYKEFKEKIFLHEEKHNTIKSDETFQTVKKVLKSKEKEDLDKLFDAHQYFEELREEMEKSYEDAMTNDFEF